MRFKDDLLKTSTLIVFFYMLLDLQNFHVFYIEKRSNFYKYTLIIFSFRNMDRNQMLSTVISF